MLRIAVIVLTVVGCGDGAPGTHDAVPPDGATADAAGCTVPPTPDAAPASAEPACIAGGVPGSCIPVDDCHDSRAPTPGLCAGPATVQCCTPRFADDVRCDPNVTPDPNACLGAEAPGDPGCPAGMARVTTFCIDRFEAAIDGESPYHPPPAGGRAVSKRGAVPQGNISQVAAGAACAIAGKRLCSDAEWLRACRGPGATTYPYGDTRQPGVCNDARAVHPAVELYGTTDAWIFGHLDSPCLGQEAGGLAPTGSHPGCVTAEGALDMMGNLHEWTADPAGTFRGGFYVDTQLNGDGCLYVTTAHDVSYSDYSTGFRCCADGGRSNAGSTHRFSRE